MNDLDCIVLCGGKCGSSTLAATMRNNGYKTIKIHNEQDFIVQFKYNGLVDSINASSSSKPLIIIDSYRTPLERKISSMFQNLNKHMGKTNSTYNEIVEVFNTKIFALENDNISYMDNILKNKGALIKEFDFDQGYSVKKIGNITFIKLLFKNISIWDVQLSNILNKQITIKTDNISKLKPYTKLYETFKQNYKVPLIELERMCKTDSFKLYNSELEQKAYFNLHKLNSI